MDRDYGAEIDGARTATSARSTDWRRSCRDRAQAKGRVVKMPDMHPDPAIMAVLDQLEDSCNAHQDSGRLTYMGVFSLGGRQSTWIRNDVSANHLLSLVENHGGRVLAALAAATGSTCCWPFWKKPRTVAIGGGMRVPFDRAGMPSFAAAHRGRPGNRSQWRGKRLLCHPAAPRAGYHPAPGWHWDMVNPEFSRANGRILSKNPVRNSTIHRGVWPIFSPKTQFKREF